MPLSSNCPDDIVGSIYENLAGDDPWQEAIEKLRILLAASNTMIRISHKGPKRRDAIFAYGPKVDQEKIKDWEDHLYREVFPVSPTLGQVMYFQWEDILSQGAMMDSLRHYDSSWTIVHCFFSAEKFDCLLIASRERNEDAFSDADGALLNVIGAHFGRALRLRRELLRARLTSEFQAEGLDRMAIAGVLVEQSGSMMLLNDAAKSMVAAEDGLRFRNGQLHATDDQEDRRLQIIIRQILSSENETILRRAMSLTRGTGTRRLGLVISGRRSVSMISGKPELSALIFVRDTETASDLDVELLQQLFSFTRAEAKLAIGLAKGKRLDELEAELHIRHNTARAHLRSMFLKADVGRQAQLVQLLANCVAQSASADFQNGAMPPFTQPQPGNAVTSSR